VKDEQRRRVAATAVVGLAALAVLFVWASGPIRWGAPRWTVVPPRQPLQTAEPQPSVSHPPAPVSTVPEQAQKILMLVGAILLCVVLLFVLYQLARRLRRTSRVRRDASAGDLTGIPTAIPAPDAEPEPEPVVQGLERALRILDDERSADDAIVQAWLGLEEASVASGAGRRPAETPSEYAARVITRFDTDADAVDVLLDLYQGVRFGTRHADADTIRTARECIVRLTRSWHADAPTGSR
jgi:HAMP domain-containing protein